jgi:hypothetical protein
MSLWLIACRFLMAGPPAFLSTHRQRLFVVWSSWTPWDDWIAKEPHSQLAQILKAKNHHDTSIWRAKHNIPKSAFWTGILKVRPLLISATAYQIVDGDSSLWSTPWVQGWETIYDSIIIQQQPFKYLAQIKDLWLSGQKLWNVSLINSLFFPALANSILQTPIIEATGQDILVWKLTPAGLFSPKSAYKHCFNVVTQHTTACVVCKSLT